MWPEEYSLLALFICSFPFFGWLCLRLYLSMTYIRRRRSLTSEISGFELRYPSTKWTVGPNKHGCPRRRPRGNFVTPRAENCGAPSSPNVYNSTQAFDISLGCPCLPMRPILSPYLRHLNEASDKADRVTPQGLTAQKRMDELMLSIALSGLQDNVPLRR